MDQDMEKDRTMELVNPDLSTYYIKRNPDGTYDEGMLDKPLDVLKTDLQTAILKNDNSPCGVADDFLVTNRKILPNLLMIRDDGRPSEEIMMDIIKAAYRNGDSSVVLSADTIDEITEAAETIRSRLPEYPWVEIVYFIFPSLDEA